MTLVVPINPWGVGGLFGWTEIGQDAVVLRFQELFEVAKAGKDAYREEARWYAGSASRLETKIDFESVIVLVDDAIELLRNQQHAKAQNGCAQRFHDLENTVARNPNPKTPNV
ncbi:hypothetical protein PHYPSEUDO_008217 [Phytophthora pseudosyringae]|uniref:Uncharacterized protein n=1 Tax=Phytophthora pseudosyringae TaxID=221518 RepID=A0A8T1VHW6_9STRA|nr:hypothetical protein PHYPSEUDO_008217 [Phytophthora pseudosyringae]